MKVYHLRRFLILFLLFASTLSVQSRKTMREVWVTMPDSVIPYLNHELRVELADYWDMKADAKVKNLLECDTRLMEMTDSYMGLALNGSTDVSMRLLATGDSTYIICMVKTLKAPAEESCIRFYSTEWELLDGTFGLPGNGDPDKTKEMFIEARDTMTVEHYDKLYGMIEPVMLAARLSANEETVTFSLSLPFLTSDEKADVSSILRQRKFKWDGKTFKEC